MDEDQAGSDEEPEEAVEEERVRPARPAVLEEAAVRQHLGQHAREGRPETEARRGTDGPRAKGDARVAREGERAHQEADGGADVEEGLEPGGNVPPDRARDVRHRGAVRPAAAEVFR